MSVGATFNPYGRGGPEPAASHVSRGLDHVRLIERAVPAWLFPKAILDSQQEPRRADDLSTGTGINVLVFNID